MCSHAFRVADLDGDGKDEILYGSAAIDDNGKELWCTGNGHGDCLYVGKFIQTVVDYKLSQVLKSLSIMRDKDTVMPAK